ncbi:manganese efflux pump MntP [Treponema sp.]|uniref:manganese efflux pump MntP n=1 Tax=Treponema sp. TaxID=166 RepID=UPI003F062DCD
MSVLELFILAVGLSMDAFAVSICKGLAAKKISFKEMCIAGAWFGGFQALMPFLGWILGSRFKYYIENFDHWIAFLLLVAIGANMIREAFSDECEKVDNSFALKTMFVMAVATSIDALAVGITFGLLLDSWKEIILASLFICSITFCFSAAGVKIGSVFGNKYEKKAEIAGGIILILIGIKILLNHLGIL